MRTRESEIRNSKSETNPKPKIRNDLLETRVFDLFRNSECGIRISNCLRHRAGFSVLEMEIALVLFGISIAGLCPLAVMQARQLQNLQSRLAPQTTYYLVPTGDVWARKLGAGASLANQLPASSAPPSQPSPVNTVTIQALAKSLTSEVVTAQVTVQRNP
jgi:hypothetical protein